MSYLLEEIDLSLTLKHFLEIEFECETGSDSELLPFRVSVSSL